MCSPCGRRVDSAHGRRPQRAGADGGRRHPTGRIMRNTKRTPSSRAANERDTAATITSSERWAMSWNCWGVWFRGAEPLAAPEKGCEWTMTKPSTRWACGKSVTEPQYPAKSISSSAAHIRFVLFRIAGKITTIHDIRQSQESGISKVHSLNRQSVGYYSTRSETAISSFLRKAFGKVADTRPLRMIASSAVRQLPTETLK